jgi:glycosyltransferase involved in cell wall biosynthesis
MKFPFFTVIIATHKRPKLLERAIYSVLNQTYKNNNFIVVSDIIDEPTFTLVSELLRPNDLFVQRNGLPGPSQSRNTALELADGTHVVFLDDDDAFHPHFLKNVSEKIQTHNIKGIIYTNAEVCDLSKNNGMQKIDFSLNSDEDLFVKNFLPNNCVIYPTTTAKNIKFDLLLAYEDWDYLLSAITANEIEHIPIDGPIIFKNSDEDEKPRGEKNNSSLVECYLNVYTKHSNVKKEILQKRIELFKSINLDLEVLLKGELNKNAS